MTQARVCRLKKGSAREARFPYATSAVEGNML